MAQKTITKDQLDFGPGPNQLTGTQPGDNILINGDFRIWQRTNFNLLLTGSEYTTDRWEYVAINTVTGISFFRQTTGPTGSPIDTNNHFNDYMEITAGGTVNPIPPNQAYLFQQKIEGLNMQSLLFGSTNAREMTLSFWHAHAETGTFCVAFGNDAGDRSYVTEYTQNVADAWEYTTVTIPGETTGTWLIGAQNGMSVSFAIACGTNFHGPANTWNAGVDYATSNQTNTLTSLSSIFRFANIKLEIGNVSTPFLQRPFVEELRLCQRYYAKTIPIDLSASINQGVGGTLTNYAFTTGALSATWEYPVIMRTTPTVSRLSYLAGGGGLWWSGDGLNNVASNVQVINERCATIRSDAVIPATKHYHIHLDADAEL